MLCLKWSKWDILGPKVNIVKLDWKTNWKSAVQVKVGKSISIFRRTIVMPKIEEMGYKINTFKLSLNLFIRVFFEIIPDDSH